MEKLEMFVDLLKGEVCTIGDARFGFVDLSLRNLNAVDFSFRLGTMYSYFGLELDDLDSDDLVLMKYNAATLADKAYKCLIRKIKYDYRHILVDLVDIIKYIVQKSPIDGFEVTGVEYDLSTATVKFEIFGLEQSCEIDLSLMDSYGGSKKYAEYVVGRVIANGAGDVARNIKKGL